MWLCFLFFLSGFLLSVVLSNFDVISCFIKLKFIYVLSLIYLKSLLYKINSLWVSHHAAWYLSSPCNFKCTLYHFRVPTKLGKCLISLIVFMREIRWSEPGLSRSTPVSVWFMNCWIMRLCHTCRSKAEGALWHKAAIGYPTGILVGAPYKGCRRSQSWARPINHCNEHLKVKMNGKEVCCVTHCVTLKLPCLFIFSRNWNSDEERGVIKRCRKSKEMAYS